MLALLMLMYHKMDNFFFFPFFQLAREREGLVFYLGAR